MKLVIDIPDYNLDNVQNGSIACGQVLKAIKNGKPYEERSKGEWNEIQAGMFVCPFCGARPHKDFKNFCANCGAKMKGGAE